MTKQEAIVVSAYTGYCMCDFNEMHKYIEEKLGRPVFTHEFALDLVQNEIHEKVKPDFLKICEEANKEDETKLKTKQSEWIRIDKHTVQCPQCHRYLDLRGVNAGRGDANYCPCCGMKMKVQE